MSTECESSDEVKPCPICGGEVTGYHYGIESCESCKAFFRRTVQQNKAFSCLGAQNCVISVSTRRLCPACRFHKCLQAGMVVTAVREDRERGGRSPYSTRRKPRKKPLLAVTSIDSEHGNDSTDSYPKFGPVLLDCITATNSLCPINYQVSPIKSEDARPSSCSSDLSNSSDFDSSPQEFNIDELSRNTPNLDGKWKHVKLSSFEKPKQSYYTQPYTDFISRKIKWACSLKSFRLLTDDVKLVCLESNWATLSFLDVIENTLNGQNMVKVENDSSSSKCSFVINDRGEKMSHYPGADPSSIYCQLFDGITQIIRSVRKVNITQHDLALIRFSALFSFGVNIPMNHGNVECRQTERLQMEALLELEKLCKQNSNAKNSWSNVTESSQSNAFASMAGCDKFSSLCLIFCDLERLVSDSLVNTAQLSRFTLLPPATTEMKNLIRHFSFQ